MLDNSYFLTLSVFFVFFLAAFIGVLVSIFFENRAITSGQNQKPTRFIKATVTLVMTALITVLVFWVNIRISGRTSWLNVWTNPNHPTTSNPTEDIDDS